MMGRKRVLVLSVSILSASAVGTFASGRGDAGGTAEPVSVRPSSDAAMLNCGNGLAMIFDRFLSDAGPGAESTSGPPAYSALAALQGLADEAYPAAPVASAEISQVDELRGETKLQIRDSSSRLVASFIVSRVASAYTVTEWSVCESTAQEWAR